MSEIKIEDKKVKTPKFRMSYPNLKKAKAFGGGDPKFGLTMIYPKTTKLGEPVLDKNGKKISISLLRALKNAAVEKWGANAEAVIEKLKKSPKGWPIRSGNKDKPDQPEYKDCFFVACSAKEDNPPGMVGQDRQPISADELYAGCYARAELLAYAYDNEFGKGLGFSLQNIQKLGDGKKFSGKKDASEAFDAVEDESDDPDNYEEESEDDDGLGF